MKNEHLLHSINARALSSALEPRLDNAWIDDQGQFWGTREGSHMEIITQGFGLYGYKPEDKGWVLIFGKDSHRNRNSIRFWLNIGKDEPTEIQKEALRRFGFDPEDQHTPRNPDIKFEDLYPHGYDDHVLPEDAGEIFRNMSAAPEPS